MTSADQPGVYLTQEEFTALVDEVKILNNAGIVEVAVRNPQVMEYMQHWEGRAEKAEAERDRLREALAEHSMPCTCHEAYSGRKMQDPECRAGEYGDYCREAIGLPPLCQYNIRALKGDQT